MSTTPTPDLSAQLAQHIADLGHRHASVSYFLIGTLALVMAVCAAGGYFALKSFDAQLARAERQEQQYQQDRSQWQAQMAQHDTERTAQALQIQQLQEQINKRDTKPLPPAVQAGMKPGAPATVVSAGVTVAYGDVLGFGSTTTTPDGSQVILSPIQGQSVIQAKVEGDKAKADLKDTQAIVELQGQTVVTLKTDLKGCQDTVGEANKTIAGYKKAAVKSRWQKFLGGAKTALLMAGSAYLGHKL